MTPAGYNVRCSRTHDPASATVAPVTTLPLADLSPGQLAELIEAFEFKPYRHYRTYSRKQQAEILGNEVDLALGDPGGFGRAAGVGADRVAVVGRTLSWDTQFFGVPMGRIDYVLCGLHAPDAALDAALDASLDAARATGLRHLTARVDVADLRTMGRLESRGFRTMDALVTYIMRPVKDPPVAVRTVGTIRESRAEDHAAIIEITAEAYRGYRGRFHFDPHLSPERADALYVEWARQCVSGAMADIILVSEDSAGVVIGYLAYRRRQPASSVGMPIFGGGLGACRKDSPGAYASLIRDATDLVARARRHGRVSDAELQLPRHQGLRSGGCALRTCRVHAPRVARLSPDPQPCCARIAGLSAR